MKSSLRKENPAIPLVFDLLAWTAAVIAAAYLRYEFNVFQVDIVLFASLGATVSLIHLFAGTATGLYRSRFREASFDQLVALLVSTFLVFVPTSIATIIWGPDLGVPRSVLFIATPIFLLLSGGLRALTRISRLQASTSSLAAKRTVVYGAGSMAEVLIPLLLEDPTSSYRPVGLVDDDPTKSKKRVAGIRTLGSFSNIDEIFLRTNASTLIVSIPRANSELLEKIRKKMDSLGKEVLILPSFSEILESKSSGIPLKMLGIEDVVGRRAVSINSKSIDTYIRSSTVMVTGAGGSIGVELCRQVARHSPKKIVFLDRDETGLQQAQLAVSNSGLLDNSDFVLADIREESTIAKVFSGIKPDVVFHAAALKHLPVLERFPHEAWKTNVLGTANVLKAAADSKVKVFVNISTDKAADPVSILGRSKRIAEELTAWYGLNTGSPFLSVRFGNVLGSRGSLVPTLAHQIESGGPVTITDPGATRYFMTVTEACHLVLQAGSETDDGAVLVLDMGEPVRIVEIAEKMIEMSGKKIDITFTGLRQGEKLHEQLHSALEERRPSNHPLIWKVYSSQLSPKKLAELEPDFLPR